MSEYSPRVLDAELDELVAALPAIAVEGPKGVGKSATLRRRAATEFRLDELEHRTLAEASPKTLLSAPPPVLIDEWQKVPQVWDAVRREIDEDPRTPNRYLLAGSATPQNAPTHSGAARIVTLRMRPMALSERGIEVPTVSMASLLTGERAPVAGTTTLNLAGYAREIVRSGFPGLRHYAARPLRAQLDGYLRQIVERDFPDEAHPVRRPDALYRWMAAYAAATGTTASLEKIRTAATSGEGDVPAKTTSMAYRAVLERLWIVDPVWGWLPSRNLLARLTQAPKHHMADPALAARLLGIDERALLHGKTATSPGDGDGMLFGRLFESLVTLSVRVYAQAAEAQVRHLRTKDGRQEVDVIVERGDHRVVGIEVKLGATVTDHDVRHLLWLRDTLPGDVLDLVVITTGTTAYRRKDGIAVVPASLLGP